ncbi:MAG: AGE family epimerase/isomerase [Sphaerochaetaceae bacterium]
MNKDTQLKEIKKLYEKQLLEGELDFWIKYGWDKNNGGIYTALDREGLILDTDKSVWFQGRALWVFSEAYKKYGNLEYLEFANSIAKFLTQNCFDQDGRMFFRVSEDGKPIIKRIRYFFSEAFAVIGLSSYAEITHNSIYKKQALDLFKFIKKLKNTKGLLIPKFQRDSKSFSNPMILINVLSELRKSFPEEKNWINTEIDECLSEITNFFVKDDLEVVLEQCGMDGSFQSDHFEGRLINPGHSIEGAWFIMNEGMVRNDSKMINLGLKILKWMWDKGWDYEYGGGIIQYRDALGKDLSDYHQDMKFWWPQCEIAIAELMAYKITKDSEHFDKFLLVNEYIQKRFVDNEFGEWFGYLHRDGTIATNIKGNMYKGPFHIPRMYMKCIELIG